MEMLAKVEHAGISVLHIKYKSYYVVTAMIPFAGGLNTGGPHLLGGSIPHEVHGLKYGSFSCWMCVNSLGVMNPE